MRNAAISFPMLGDNFSICPTTYFSFFGWHIHWYGVIIACGFLLALFYISKNCRKVGITMDDMIDALILAVPLGIICARAYYVIFYWELYASNPISALYIWEGGLAIYGGIIGGAIGIILVTLKKKISVGAMFDMCAFGLLIGQSVGRWGNFMNREAYGYETDIFCRMGLTPASGNTIYVHPTFLYESLWNLIGFILLHIFSKRCRRKFDGQLFLMYVAWYGAGRVWIEGLRTDSLYFFNTGIRISQLLAGVSCVAAIVVIICIISKRKGHEKPLWVDRISDIECNSENE